MRMRNPVQVSGDKTPKIIMAILRLIVFMVLLLLIVFLEFSYQQHGHTAYLSDITGSWQIGPFFYIHLSDGHVYEASACKKELDQTGNGISFTAIGLDLSIGGLHITPLPKIVSCMNWYMDFPFELPQ